jgi:hypothetical protein
VKGKPEDLALVRRVAARIGPLAGATHVGVHGSWGAETDSIVGYDVWNGRAVAVLRVEPGTDSLIRRGTALVGVATRVPAPRAMTVTPAGQPAAPAVPACVRDSVPDVLRARVTLVRDSLVRWMTDSLHSPFPRLAQATAVRGDAVFGCFGAWRAVVIATSRTPTLEWNEERALLVAPDGKVSTARLRDLRLHAHELPVTFPRATGQVPIYYAQKNTGRPAVASEPYTSKYIDIPWTPQFAFGHGLSYTTFAYSDLRLSSPSIRAGQSVDASVTVRNTGTRDGVEVVQLYMRHDLPSVTRPVRELRGFQRVALKAGESRTVKFTLAPADFALYDLEMRHVVEPGTYHFWAGGSSEATLGTQLTIGGTTLVLAPAPPRMR